ncbi:hypothetical protein HPP92_012676 [Vanilla planifolia]|uniref:CD2 antigen cytoplasmic tail-binding protein 2 n=1 Tax=Vanilla planifolia TaxID=51239 RepID=A0A835R208_VANPL|nr:hypothetical protein HPP92_012676 [Vanilla planifolia]
MEASKGSKRPFAVEDDNGRPPSPRKVRFPKGKKLKVKESLGFADVEGSSNGQLDPDFAAKERAKRRSERREEEVAFGSTAEISLAEVQYEDDSTFEIDGIEIEPFNLKQELKEGYFEESGNFVEYKREREIKDAWLDSVSIDSRFVAKREERKLLKMIIKTFPQKT